MAKKHDHGFEMMVMVAIVAVVGLIMMFMNTENLSGEAFGGNPKKITTAVELIDWGNGGLIVTE